VIQPVGIVCKGSGFYVTDNRKTSSAALPGERKSAAAKDEGSSDTTGSKASDSAEASSSG
jgi:predicted nucleic acid-binding Zn ribbon protein